MPSRPLSLPLQTLYADLLEQCANDAFNEAFAEDGTFVVKEIDGRRYWYFQLPAAAAQKQKYVGVETPELLERIERHRRIRHAARARRSLVSTLVRSGVLPRPMPRIGTIIAALAKAGVFRLRGVLVGTIAYQTYSGMLGIRLPTTGLQTSDVDIAQFANVSVAVEDATPPMVDVLRTVDASFREVPHLHDPRRATKYQAADGAQVDFLTPNEVADSDEPRPLAAFGTDAEPLRFLDFLIHSPEPAVVLVDAGIHVLVPAPERYAVHKLIVAQRRAGGVGNAKRGKDLHQAEALLGVLADMRPNELSDAWSEAENRGSKWSDAMLASLALLDQQARDRTLALLGKVRAIIPGLDLTFPGTAARNDLERDAVVLWANAGKRRIRCIVSRETLEDNYGGDGLDGPGRLKKFQDNRTEIESLVREKYLRDPIEEFGTVILRTMDVERLRARVTCLDSSDHG